MKHSHHWGQSPLPAVTEKPTVHLPVQVRFGQRLRELRHRRRYTQLQMANRFGIDRSYISELERGNKVISINLLEIIALGFKMPLSDLLTEL